MSDCGLYRYSLSRSWSEAPPLLFIMLNPSTADDVEDDPTIRRCIGYAKREGGGGLLVGNLFAFRATNPANMRATADPIGPENDAHLLAMVRTAKHVVCGWGAHGSFQNRDVDVMRMIRSAGVVPYALKLISSGAPGHPLRLPNNAPLLAL